MFIFFRDAQKAKQEALKEKISEELAKQLYDERVIMINVYRFNKKKSIHQFKYYICKYYLNYF